MSKVALNSAAIAALEKGADVGRGLLRVGDQVATRAAGMAPRDSGAGAASIHAQAAGDEVRVGPDAKHFYLIFHEVGTSKKSARPFLRPALDGQYDA